MKIKMIYLAIMLMCLCCRNADNSHPESLDTTFTGRHSESVDRVITRHYEVIKIINDYGIKEMEDYFNKYPKARKGFKRIKPLHIQVTPMLIGPLTMGQVVYKLNEVSGKSPEKDIPKSSFNYENDHWNEVLSKYKDGDEFYYYKSDARDFIPFSGMSEGFILIRNNGFIGNILIGLMIQ